MTGMLIRSQLRTAPVPVPIKGTLLDVVTPSEGLDFLEADGLYSSMNCLPTDAYVPLCPDVTTDDKVFNGIDVVDGARFAIQNGVTCKSVGLDWEEVGTDLECIFTYKESTAVERYILTDPDATGALLQGADDLTPTGLTTALSPEAGLAILQGAGDGYAGQMTFHIPRPVASYLLSLGQGSLMWDGNMLRTQLGDPVSAGLGYLDFDGASVGPDGAPAATGTYWMYVSGTVQLSRSETLQTRPVVNTVTNDVFILTERAYLASIDCFKAAVLVQLFDGS